jgi:hypothetical protein
MRRLLSLPAALMLIVALGTGLASADPVNGHNSLLLFGTCDDGATWSYWVTPAAGHAVLDTSSTTNTVTLAIKLWYDGDLFVDETSTEAGKIPANLLTECTGYVVDDPLVTFWELSLITPA